MILHRDIKPGNIFLDGDKTAKLGDFGLARILTPDSLFAHTYVGTPYYMSPVEPIYSSVLITSEQEQIIGNPYNEKCDIWSLGCLVYELAALS